MEEKFTLAYSSRGFSAWLVSLFLWEFFRVIAWWGRLVQEAAPIVTAKNQRGGERRSQSLNTPFKDRTQKT